MPEADDGFETVRRDRDPRRQGRRATELLVVYQQRIIELARLRREAIRRLQDEEGLSYAAVAAELGLSKGRIGQITQSAPPAERGLFGVGPLTIAVPLRPGRDRDAAGARLRGRDRVRAAGGVPARPALPGRAAAHPAGRGLAAERRRGGDLRPQVLPGQRGRAGRRPAARLPAAPGRPLGDRRPAQRRPASPPRWTTTRPAGATSPTSAGCRSRRRLPAAHRRGARARLGRRGRLPGRARGGAAPRGRRRAVLDGHRGAGTTASRSWRARCCARPAGTGSPGPRRRAGRGQRAEPGPDGAAADRGGGARRCLGAGPGRTGRRLVRRPAGPAAGRPAPGRAARPDHRAGRLDRRRGRPTTGWSRAARRRRRWRCCAGPRTAPTGWCSATARSSPSRPAGPPRRWWTTGSPRWRRRSGSRTTTGSAPAAATTRSTGRCCGELVGEQRRHRNCRGGYWIAEADPAAAGHALVRSWPAGALAAAALATDGVTRGIGRIGLPSWSAALDLMRTGGPAAVLGAVRAVEAADPDGRRWPRSKRHDDQALVVVSWAQPARRAPARPAAARPPAPPG